MHDECELLHHGDVQQRFSASLKTLTWICSCALAAVMASERLYWYWSGIDADSLSVLTAFYAVGTATAFWMLSRVPGGGARRAVFGGAMFALIVEGIITPVVYEDGPLPILFLMFLGWHGLLAFVGFIYTIRRWALLERSRVMAIAAMSTGACWGVWAVSSAVTDRETAAEFALDGASARVLAPGEFAVYAAWVGVVLVGAHLVMDRTWPRIGWRPSRFGVFATVAVVVGFGLLMVVPVVPWAPLKLAVLAWMIQRLFRRSAASTGQPTVIDELAGRIRARSLLPVLLLPIAASMTYAGLWALRDASSLAIVFWSLVGLQVAAGLAAASWVIYRSHSLDRPHRDRRSEAAAASVF